MPLRCRWLWRSLLILPYILNGVNDARREEKIGVRVNVLDTNCFVDRERERETEAS